MTLEEESLRKKRKVERQERLGAERKKAASSTHLYLQRQNVDMALGRFRVWCSTDPSARWSSHDLQQVIRLLVDAQRWDEAIQQIEAMVELLPDEASGYRLLQSKIQILKNGKPMDGMKALGMIDVRLL